MRRFEGSWPPRSRRYALLCSSRRRRRRPRRCPGAIFTTDVSGVPVNLNNYAAKEDVYLNGGPGINAPDDAAGLPPGIYAFQVTDPTGKTLLSTDPVECRKVKVDAAGVFVDVVATNGCEHATGADGEDGGATVQLFPYDNTPNPGGVYKVWMTPTERSTAMPPATSTASCRAYSKTDNFKVRGGDRRDRHPLLKPGAARPLDGLAATWTDTNGAPNRKWSEYNPRVLAFHEAHVEAAEQGNHRSRSTTRPAASIEDVHAAGKYLPPGGRDGDRPGHGQEPRAGDRPTSSTCTAQRESTSRERRRRRDVAASRPSRSHNGASMRRLRRRRRGPLRRRLRGRTYSSAGECPAACSRPTPWPLPTRICEPRRKAGGAGSTGPPVTT